MKFFAGERNEKKRSIDSGFGGGRGGIREKGGLQSLYQEKKIYSIYAPRA